MSDNGNNVAFPIYNQDGELDWFEGGASNAGLTKREMMAMNIMSGFAGDSELRGSLESIAEASVKWADALLNELDK